MKKITSCILAIISMIILVPTMAFAINSEPSSLTLVMEFGDLKLCGMDMSVCRVADARETPAGIVFDVAPPFSGAGVEFSDLSLEKNIALAAQLHAYASANNVSRDVKTTNNSGRTNHASLPAGLYLVAQMDVNACEYIVAPYLVAVPAVHEEQAGKWTREVVAYPKSKPVKRDQENISLNVNKIWVGAGSNPSYIQVQLYRNGSPHGSAVTLNSGNYWSHTWVELNAKDTWTVDEINVPAEYKKTISGSVSTGYIITNTRDNVPPSPRQDAPGNPKTEDASNMQLWITLLIVSSIGFIAVLCILTSKRIFTRR